MNIAMGLQQAKELRDRIGVLEDRIKENLFCVVGGGEPAYPDHDFTEMDRELTTLRLSLVKLMTKIDKANHIVDSEGESVYSLRQKQGTVLNELAFCTALRAAEPDRYKAREGVQFIKRMPVMELDKKLDELTNKRREFDHKVRAKNALIKLED